MSIATPALAEFNFNHNATLSTDYFIRGLTRTLYDPSLRYGGELQSGSFLAGFNFITADYPGIGQFADDSSNFEYTLHLGYFKQLSQSISWQTQFAFHEYIGGSDQLDGDYFEGSVSLHLPYNIGLSYLLTKNEHQSDDFAQYFEVSLLQPITAYLVASGTFGLARTDTIINSNYEYTDLGITVLINTFSLDFRQHISFGSAGNLQALADDHFVVSLTKTF